MPKVLFWKLVPVFCVFLFVLFLTPRTFAASFTFTAAGDYDGNANSDTVLNGIKSAAPNFNVAVGDFRYDSKSNPAGWATYVKGIVGASFPFEIISGNHDASSIDQYTPALPDRVGGVVGQYGKEYYFDYPTTGPIARFIFTAPSEIYSYSSGSTHYTFVSNAIDDARTKGIKWIFVNHHKNCVTAGVKSCEIGADFMNLLITKKVDVVIQGHEHAYERSKQLTCAKVNTYDATCVANATSSLTKGAGTVFLIIGTGGRDLRPIDTGDPEYPYFASSNGSVFGYGKFTVTDTQLTYNFVRTAGASYTDSMTISGTGTGVTPSTSSGPSAIPTTTNPTNTPPTSGPSPSNPPSGSTVLNFHVFLHGIGKGGDNVNPQALGTSNPLHPTRTVNVTLTGTSSSTTTAQGSMQFNSTAGNFTASVVLPSTINTGPYTVQVRTDRFLSKTYPTITTITKGQAINGADIFLTNGDANNDNLINPLDYNMILDCFSDLTPARNCDATRKLNADFNDDGNVNQFDYNLLLRELSVQNGNGPTTPPVTSTTSPQTNGMPTSGPVPTIGTSSGVWLSSAEIMKLPTSGAAWDNVKSAANSSWGSACLYDLNCNHDVNTLAGALVAVRMNDSAMRSKVIAGLQAATKSSLSRALELSRGLQTYIIAADIIGYHDAAFEAWVRSMLTTSVQGHSGGNNVLETAMFSSNNWGGHARASVAAAAVYLKDATLMNQVVTAHKAFIGTASSSQMVYTTTTWHASSSKAGENRKGAVVSGKNVSGVLPEDWRRGDANFTWLPSTSNNYYWEGMQGYVVAAVILSRAGQVPFNAGDNAVVRAMDMLYGTGEAAANSPAFHFPPTGDDTWIPWVVNKIAGTNYPTNAAAAGKNMAWTDWTHAR